MKKICLLLMSLILSAQSFAAGGASDSLTVSSGTFKAIDLITNNTGNARQVITVGDPVGSQAMQVDTSSSAFVNIKEVNGTTIDTNSGAKSAGTTRIVIATDQPALTNALKIDGSAVTQPISGTVTDTQSTPANLQSSVFINGSSNTVVANAGTGTFNIQSNASVNTAQVNGATTLTNNGISGAGSQRVNIAYDNTPFQTSMSPEISQVFVTTTSFVAVSTFSNIAASTTDGILISGISNKNIYVLAVVIVTGGTATTVTFNQKPAGAGTAISMTFANAANGGAVLPFSYMPWFATTTKGNGLSVTTGSGSTTGIQVLYVAY